MIIPKEIWSKYVQFRIRLTHMFPTKTYPHYCPFPSILVGHVQLQSFFMFEVKNVWLYNYPGHKAFGSILVYLIIYISFSPVIGFKMIGSRHQQTVYNIRKRFLLNLMLYSNMYTYNYTPCCCWKMSLTTYFHLCNSMYCWL